MRRRIPSALLLTALAATSVAAVAPSRGDAAPADVRAPQPAALVEALVPDEAGVLSEEQLVRARRLAYAMTPGVTPLFQDEATGPDQTSEPVATEVPDVSWVAPAPDLDGDGLDDVFVRHRDDEPALLRAVRGIDGAELWAVDGAGWWFRDRYGIGDVDGDGIEDVLVTWFEDYDYSWSYASEDGSDGRSHAEESEATWRSITELRSGVDGSLLRRIDRPGFARSVREEEARDAALPTDDSSERFRDVDELHDGLTWLMPSADHDGDGVTDLVDLSVSARSVSEYEESSNLVHRRSSGLLLSEGSASAAVVRANGETIWTPPAEETARVGWLLPAGDLDGDGGTDLLWSAEGNTDVAWSCEHTLVLGECSDRDDSDPHHTYAAAYRGHDLTTIWATDSGSSPSLMTYGALGVSPLWADADGDGTDDLLAGAALLSGADASLVWEREGDWWGLRLLGADADGTVTLLSTEQAYGSETCAPGDAGWQERLVLTRVDGRDGSDRFSTEHVSGTCDTQGQLSHRLGGDVDGDGLEDILVWSVESAPGEWDGEWNSLVEAAADGSTYRFPTDAYVSPAADLDGDGAAEMEVRTYDQDRMTSVMVSPLQQRELWRVEDRDGYFAWTDVLGDVDGDGGRDVAMHEFSYGDESTWSRASVRSGRDLTVLWAGTVDTRPWAMPGTFARTS